ncbi:proline dehydrogenase family protein [Nocardiopsis potens]|uniref:proline dehydrogenase family protein n=1 Tax=Nocardiopsis potens TaxID=1246458 RepID=UPI000367D495|nr:proline dehydrogenase family protein [Nocardiopsis potens]
MVLRNALLAVSGSGRLRSAAERSAAARGMVRRFIAGEEPEDAVRTVGELAGKGLLATVDRLGEDVRHPAAAEEAVRGYLGLLERLDDAGLTGAAEVSVKPSAVGLGLGPEGAALARSGLDRICAAAAEAGTTVTLDMEDESAVQPTLDLLRGLRPRHPSLGVAVQSQLRRTEEDVRALAAQRVRVRLVKGAYAAEPPGALTARRDVDAAYVRCLRTLMAGDGYPMVATHDPRLIGIARTLAARYGRDRKGYELQMIYGARPDEQVRLAAGGERMRIYVPYGRDWYGYLLRRLAERPANVVFAARSLATRG